MSTPSTRPITEDSLLRELERLPARRAAAVQALHVADDPTSSSTDLAVALGAEPVLTAQVMRLANSAYYGLSGRVRSVDFAVTVVGFGTIRSLAAAYAVGAVGSGPGAPNRFWDHAAASAAGTALASSWFDVPRPDAFGLGLLHDLGAAVLCRLDPDGWSSLEADSPAVEPPSGAERDHFGIDHAQVAAVVLDSWHFPVEMTVAIRDHHEPVPGSCSALLGCLRVGHALAALAELDEPDDPVVAERWQEVAEDLGDLEVDAATAFTHSRTVRDDAVAIAGSFTVG